MYCLDCTYMPEIGLRGAHSWLRCIPPKGQTACIPFQATPILTEHYLPSNPCAYDRIAHGRNAIIQNYIPLPPSFSRVCKQPTNPPSPSLRSCPSDVTNPTATSKLGIGNPLQLNPEPASRRTAWASQLARVLCLWGPGVELSSLSPVIVNDKQNHTIQDGERLPVTQWPCFEHESASSQ